MKYDYNETLRAQIYALRSEYGMDGQEFEIDDEQAFLKRKDLKPGTIYVLTRNLQNQNQIGVDTQPVQILILAEQNGLDAAKAFFGAFAKKYNWLATLRTYADSEGEHTIWVKQQYADPVVLSNFNSVGYGYRSVLYMSATLFIMYDVVDLRDLYIDDAEKTAPYSVMGFDLAYSMNPNTQQLTGSNQFISRSVKSVSTLALTISIPVTESALISKVLSIMNETDSAASGQTDGKYGGNEDFVFDFYLGSVHFENKAFKLTMADFGASINDVPVIKLGFMR